MADSSTAAVVGGSRPVVGTSLWKDAYRRLKKNRLAVFGFVVVCVIVAASAVGPWIIEHTTGNTFDYIPTDPALVNSLPPFSAPDGSFSWTHPMGTDDAGRDLLARVRSAISQLFLLFVALGAVSWLTTARIVRGQVMSLKSQEFILAARATGVPGIRIITRHLVPNTLGPVIVYATLTIPSVMLLEAFLSFLGLGVQAPLASWGSLAADGIQNLAVFPWQLICPGVTMALTLFSLNFLGDGLRDALDPQMRKG
jgi:ABC-type dipeptide/oligopeptide/nickel transport system permease subunit